MDIELKVYSYTVHFKKRWVVFMSGKEDRGISCFKSYFLGIISAILIVLDNKEVLLIIPVVPPPPKPFDLQLPHKLSQ